MKQALRVAGRSVALAAVTAVGLAALAVVRLAGGTPAARARRRAVVFGVWARASAFVLGMRLVSKGRAPHGAFMLVANHLSYVDVLAVAARTEAVFVARADLSSWPVLGRLSRAVGTLFADRDRRRSIPATIEEIAAALRRGQGVVLFPEGTTTGGDNVLPFRPPLLEAAARATIPVHQAVIRYRTLPGSSPASEAICWWGDMTFWRHLIRMMALPGFAARIVFEDEPVMGRDRKELARELWTGIRHRQLRAR